MDLSGCITKNVLAVMQNGGLVSDATAKRQAFLEHVSGDELAIILSGLCEQNVVDTIENINWAMEEFNERRLGCTGVLLQSATLE